MFLLKGSIARCTQMYPATLLSLKCMLFLRNSNDSALPMGWFLDAFRSLLRCAQTYPATLLSLKCMLFLRNSNDSGLPMGWFLGAFRSLLRCTRVTQH